MTNKTKRKDEIEIVPGLYRRQNKKNGFTALSLYWWAHPLRDDKWKQEMIDTIGQEEFAREYELDFTQEQGRKVYPKFSEKNIKQLLPLQGFPLLCGWDFGFHHPAIVVAQRPDEKRLIVLDEFMGNDILLDDFIQEFLEFKKKKYPDFMMRHFCDPAGKQKKDNSDKTSIDILRKFKIYPYSRRVGIETGLAIVRRKIKEIGDDGYKNLLIDPSCKLLLEGFLGGFVFPKKSTGYGEIPAVDGYYEHTQDCLRYIATGVFRNAPST